ncbi:MAG: stage 0 sporulation protein [Anaerolineae bacterium]|nr:stage 0 sporulation protein [Anaerolineae bacterium]
MAATNTPLVASIRFNQTGKLYHFDVSAYPHLKTGDYVIVETSRGRQIGQIAEIVSPDKRGPSRPKPIKAPATARDLLMKKWWASKETKALIDCREAAAEIGNLEGVKFIQASYNYDGSMLTLTFTSEEERVNTNRLRKRLEQNLHTRIEMRRVGSRDTAKILGEYGACSGPRCCAVHLSEFSPVSIKMAKAQGISMNPSEITGMCGRLRCCLGYEYEQYVEARKGLPKINRRIGTPFGEGKVIEVNALTDSVTVIVNDTRYQVMREDLIPLEEMRAIAEKAAQTRSRECRASPSKPEKTSAAPTQESGREEPSQKKSSRHRKRRPRRRRRKSGDTKSS